MNLQPVNPPGRSDQRLRCCGCSTWYPVTTLVADLDGTPFEAFYCQFCAATLRINEGKA